MTTLQRRTLARATAQDINRASSSQAKSATPAGFWRPIPYILGEDRTTGVWLVRPYVVDVTGTDHCRFAILWSDGGAYGIEGVQAAYINGQVVPASYMTHYRGLSSQTADPKLVADLPGFADTYDNLAYTVFDIPAGVFTGFPGQRQIEAVVRGIRIENPAFGTSSPASCRFVRITVTDSHSTDSIFTGVAEIEVRATVSGADQCTGGTATASSTILSGSADNAFDDDNATSWLSESGAAGPQWIMYEFTGSVDIKEILLRVGSNSTVAARGPMDFAVEYSSDGSTWETLDTITGEAPWAVSEARTYTMPDVPEDAGIWTENPGKLLGEWVRSTRFGPGLPVTGDDDVADRCDELVGGVEVRCKVGMTREEPLLLEEELPLQSAYAECLWSYDGEGVLVVPDAPVDTPAAVLTVADIEDGTLVPVGASMRQSPTEVTVAYRESSGSAEQWPESSRTVAMAGVETGDVASIPSELAMPGIRRGSEAERKALMRQRRLQHVGRIPWAAFDDAVKYQLGDVVQLPDVMGMTARLVRIMSEAMTAPGRHQFEAEPYTEGMYADDYTPGSTTTVPVGGILPYTGTGDAPAGYEDFSAADGRFLVGAGGIWARAAEFGATGFVVSGDTSEEPDHGDALPGFPVERAVFTGDFGQSMPFYKNSGRHRHGYSEAQDKTPQYVQTRLIKKLSVPGDVPAQGGFWSDGEIISSAYEALTAHLGRLHRAGAAGATGGSQLQYSLTLSLTPAGAHGHFDKNNAGYWWDLDYTNVKYAVLSAPDHDHPGTAVDVALDIPRMKLAHCIAGSGFEIVPGAIIGFDGDGALPAGWYDADGSNGTFDTRDFWIERSQPGSAGEKTAGSRQAIWSGQAALDGRHSHKGDSTPIGRLMRDIPHGSGNDHPHDISGAVPYDPPSYAMRFIQYTGVV